MKPACAFFDNDFFPIDLARLELRNRRVPAIRTSERGAHAKSASCEIQDVADCAADAVVLDPADMAEIDAALEHQILDDASDRIVGEHRDDGGVQAEAAFFFFQAEDGIRDYKVTGVQTCALPI